MTHRTRRVDQIFEVDVDGFPFENGLRLGFFDSIIFKKKRKKGTYFFIRTHYPVSTSNNANLIKNVLHFLSTTNSCIVRENQASGRVKD